MAKTSRKKTIGIKKNITSFYSTEDIHAKGQVGAAPGFVKQMPKSGQASRVKRYADSLAEKVDARNLDWLRE